MELYKLYCVLKRHTGYENMMEEMKRRMRPEVYEERRRKTMAALARLLAFERVVGETVEDCSGFIYGGKTW